MPTLLVARPAEDATEEHQVRKLAGSRHAPGDWILRAQMILHSWAGRRTTAIADEVGAIPRRCANGLPASMPRESTAWAIAQGPGADHA